MKGVTNLDSLQISYFLKVAETEHMTNAAKELHVSQPALSRSLRMLEEELGVKLFDRLGRRLVLNDNGRRFYADATQFARGVYNLKNMTQTNDEITGELTIQIRVDNLSVMQAIADFCQMYPSIRVSAVTRSNVNPTELKWDYLIDAYNPLFSQATPNCTPLFEEPYMLAVPEILPLSHGSVISLSDAKEIPFVMPTQEQELTQIIRAYCHEAGFQPICRMETNNYKIMLSLVAQGRSVALVPKLAPGVNDYPHVKLLSLREQAFRRTIFMLKAEDTELTPVTEAFRTFMMQQLRRPF